MHDSTSLTLHSTVVCSQKQISSELAGEQVVLDLHRGVYHGLNAIAARIWQLIQQPRSVAAVRDVLLGEYQVDAQRCEEDLLAILRDLQTKGLVMTVPPAG